MQTENVIYIGKLDRAFFEPIFGTLLTDEVIITLERITHIKNRHPNDFELYCEFLKSIIEKPDLILEANKPNSAMLLKSIKCNGKSYKLIVRFLIPTDPTEYKNSVITFQKVSEKRYKTYKNSEKVTLQTRIIVL